MNSVQRSCSRAAIDLFIPSGVSYYRKICLSEALLVAALVLMLRRLPAKPLMVAVLIKDRFEDFTSSQPATKNLSENSIGGQLAADEKITVVDADRATEMKRFRGRDRSERDLNILARRTSTSNC